MLTLRKKKDEAQKEKAPTMRFLLVLGFLFGSCFLNTHFGSPNTAVMSFLSSSSIYKVKEGNAIACDRNEYDEERRLESAVMILTTLIPSHPSLWMLEKTIGSLKNLNGLHPKTPVYITVDAPKTYSLDDVQRLDLYTQALYRRFAGEENRHVTIVINSVNRHITGTSRKVVFDLIDANITKYIYVLQHDLMFVPGKEINHTALVDAFDKYYNNNTIRLVGFGQFPNSKHLRKGTCQERAELGMENPLKIFDGGIDTTTNSSNSIYLSHAKMWSDNNHFTTVQYYRDMLDNLGPVPRPPEGPMQVQSNIGCLLAGTHFYGDFADGRYICHLDGRNVTRNSHYNNCPDEYRDGN